MSASKVLALTTLFLATMFAQTEWKEFTSSEGNFRVVLPETPQEQKGTERNLHRFSAVAGDESYGLTYADYSPSADWESVVNGERDFDCERFWWVCGGRKAYFSRRLSREMDPFCRTKYERGNRHLLVVCAARFCSEGRASAGEFFYISKLVSSVIKAEGVAGYGLGRSEASCRRLPSGRPGP